VVDSDVIARGPRPPGRLVVAAAVAVHSDPQASPEVQQPDCEPEMNYSELQRIGDGRT
jgi:hypothetical protein